MKKNKFKYIIFSLVAIFIIIPNSIILTMTMISKLKIVHKNKPITYYGQGVLDFYNKMPKISFFDDFAYYTMGKNSYSGEFFVNDGSYEEENFFTNAIKFHEKSIKKDNKKSKHYWKNLFTLTNLYDINNQEEKAYKLIDIAKNQDDVIIKNYGILNEAIINIKNQKYDEALLILEEVDKEIAPFIKAITGNIYKFKEDFHRAAEIYLNEENFDQEYAINQQKYSFLEDIDYMYLNDPDIRTIMNKTQKNKTNNVIDNKFRGNVKGSLKLENRDNNEIIIGLSRKSDLMSLSNKNIYYNVDSFCYVDSDGNFEMKNIVEGEYNVRLIIPNKKIGPNIYLAEASVKRGEIAVLNMDMGSILDEFYEEVEEES